MKSKKISIAITAAALFAALGSNAFADDKYVGELGSNWQEHIASTKSRAQVVAELEQARAQGLVVGGQEPFYPIQPATPTDSKSRTQVVAELEQARANGISVGAGPLYPQNRMATQPASSSAEVRAEVNHSAQKRIATPGNLYFGG